jgi:hypothetical protein
VLTLNAWFRPMDASAEHPHSSSGYTHSIAMNPFRPGFRFADLRKITALVSVLLAIFSWGTVRHAFQGDWTMQVLYPLSVAAVGAMAFMPPILRETQCESCGKRFFRTWKARPEGLCPACRMMKTMRPQQRRRLAIKGLFIIAFLLLSFCFVLLWPFAAFLEARLGKSSYPTLAVGLSAVLFFVFFGAMVLRSLVRMYRMSSPAYALRVARVCAHEAGEQMTFGPVTVTVFGPDDPTSMLKEQMEICRNRFESLVGESLQAGRTLRVFAFGTRNGFDAFFRWAYLFRSNLDGMYVAWSRPSIALTTEFPAHRLADPERIARVLLSYYLLDLYRKSPSPLWVQAGLASVVSCGGDESELARLNRKMLAALSRGTSLEPADLFDVKPRAVSALARNWQDFSSFSRYTQLISQSWSVVEFLCSEEKRLEHFLAFLKEHTVKASSEEVFQRHLGFDFESLLEQWRTWVLVRGVGSHDPPPAEHCDPLRETVIPLVQDRDADHLDRVQAIREMGRAGYVLGADALIAVLAEHDEVPAEEVVWSLESISGVALGHDVNRWKGWFYHLPERGHFQAAVE